MPSSSKYSSENAGPFRPTPATDLPLLLDRAAGLIRNLDPATVEAGELDELRERLAAGRFHLAVLGQFKRGKSTFLNALLGEAILPTSAIPLTAIPTFILPGDRRRVSVSYLEKRPPDEFTAEQAGEAEEFLRRYVTEEGNPRNRLRVEQVEVSHPAPILRRGVVLIDTPGIGSTFRHNTEAALNFLPKCDAALFMASADPPLTEVEVEFLTRVRSRIPRLFFILNKIDYLTGEELKQVMDFFRRVLREQAGLKEEATAFPISARLGLEARRKGDESLWGRSGLEAVERYLTEFLAGEKMAVLGEALSIKAGDILTDAIMRLRLAVRSLQMPVEDIEKRLMVFEQKLKEIERERRAAGDLLAGDRSRTLEFLEEYSAALREKTRSYLEGVIKETLARAPEGETGEDRLRDALAAAIPGFFEHAMGEATELCKKRLNDTIAPHQARARALIETIRRNAAELFDIPYSAGGSVPVFEIARKPCWVTYQWAATLMPRPDGLIDRLVSRKARIKRIFHRLMRQIDDLITRNVENVRWPIHQHLNQTFLTFGATLDRRLAETTAATHGAIKAALEKRKERAEEADGTVARLKRALDELEEIRERLGKGGRR